jgi:hypothetical protein
MGLYVYFTSTYPDSVVIITVKPIDLRLCHLEALS